MFIIYFLFPCITQADDTFHWFVTDQTFLPAIAHTPSMELNRHCTDYSYVADVVS